MTDEPKDFDPIPPSANGSEPPAEPPTSRRTYAPPRLAPIAAPVTLDRLAVGIRRVVIAHSALADLLLP